MRSIRLPAARIALLASLLLGLFPAGCSRAPREESKAGDPRGMTWSDVEKAARGQTVYWFMWRGDPAINKYVDSWVAPEVLRRYGITLRTADGQGNGLVNTLLVEQQAGVKEGSMDLMWINGETFAQMRSIRALWGPWSERLPNAAAVRWSSPFVSRDFGQPVAGYECPWGNVQMAMICDTTRVPHPPRSYSELASWVKAHPGRFTYDTGFTGLTFLKGVLGEMAGGYPKLEGPFREARYQAASTRLWAWLNDLKPYLWQRGETYPASVAEVHRLFANGEVDFTMSNNDAEVDNKVLQGVLPASSRSFIFDSGTIQNSHYVGIPGNARHKAGAMVVANFLLSPEAQYEKMKPAVWADGTVLDVSRLPADWQAKFASVPARQRALPRALLDAHALPELAPAYMIRLAEDWRTHVLKPQPERKH